MTNERSASVSMCIRLSLSWMSCCSNRGLPPCLRGAGMRQRHLAGVVADAERVGGKLEVAEQVAAGAVAGLLRVFMSEPFTSPTTLACGTRAFSKIISPFW